MTKEELKKEAEEYAKENNILICCDCNYYESEEDLLDAYLAGADPREKKIEELKTENNKLLDVINNQDVKIADLEKENAELESDFRICEKNADTYYDQLAKAKDLIEDMYDKIPASHSDYYKDVMERARQFIKEIEK